MLREGRLPEPEKITSSMPEARMFLYELSPITQRIASTRLDLPQPFGPTTPVRPGSILKSVGSQKLLNPARRSRSNFMGAALSLSLRLPSTPDSASPVGGLGDPATGTFAAAGQSRRRGDDRDYERKTPPHRGVAIKGEA